MAEFRALPLHGVPGRVGYCEPSQDLPAKVAEYSPAVMVMTDLRHRVAVTIEADVSINYALQRMNAAGVHLLFVVNSDMDVVGVITSTDILGEKPLRFHQDQHLPHVEIMVHDIMTPCAALDVLWMHDVLRATVGDIVLTMQSLGRQHALVLERDVRTGRPVFRGIFSIAQISRQLGRVIEPTSIARTFAEVQMILNS